MLPLKQWRLKFNKSSCFENVRSSEEDILASNTLIHNEIFLDLMGRLSWLFSEHIPCSHFTSSPSWISDFLAQAFNPWTSRTSSVSAWMHNPNWVGLRHPTVFWILLLSYLFSTDALWLWESSWLKEGPHDIWNMELAYSKLPKRWPWVGGS